MHGRLAMKLSSRKGFCEVSVTVCAGLCSGVVGKAGRLVLLQRASANSAPFMRMRVLHGPRFPQLLCVARQCYFAARLRASRIRFERGAITVECCLLKNRPIMSSERIEVTPASLIRAEVLALHAYHVPPAAGMVKLDAM